MTQIAPNSFSDLQDYNNGTSAFDVRKLPLCCAQVVVWHLIYSMLYMGVRELYKITTSNRSDLIRFSYINYQQNVEQYDIIPYKTTSKSEYIINSIIVQDLKIF